MHSTRCRFFRIFASRSSSSKVAFQFPAHKDESELATAEVWIINFASSVFSDPSRAATSNSIDTIHFSYKWPQPLRSGLAFSASRFRLKSYASYNSWPTKQSKWTKLSNEKSEQKRNDLPLFAWLRDWISGSFSNDAPLRVAAKLIEGFDRCLAWIEFESRK